MEEMGSNLTVYTAKERQTDLARMARVHPAVTVVANSLLYNGDVTVRSAGRTFLLSRTVVANPSLAAQISTVVAKSENDAGHVQSLIAILRACTHLSSLTLSAVFFVRGPADLYTALQLHHRLRSFSYGHHGVENALESIVPLLTSFPNLKHLVLDRVAAIPPGRRPASPLVQRDLKRWGPPPSYRLDHLSITTWRSIDTSGWPVEYLEWLLGSSDSLRAFEAVGFVSARPLPDVFNVLVSRGLDTTLERLAIRDFCDASSAESAWSTTSEVDVVVVALDPNSLATTFPNLVSLSLMTNADDESTFRRPTPHLVLPRRLRSLQLDDDLFLEWNLLRTVQDPQLPTTFRTLRLRGPFPSDPDVKTLRRACHDKGMTCEVIRAF
ncbi:hypothetical protein JCM10212_003839 [Sporobolomyces blumeae]